MKLLIKKLINPIELIRAYKFHKKQKKHIKSSQDLELMLYSKIIKTDMLHYGYFDDINIKPDSISIRDLEIAQMNYVDIIIEQIWIAYTGNTALDQSDINPRGHAIECRINAEDASKNFQPSPGTIGMCHQPSGFRTRVDGAIYHGYKVTPYYDSMICKLICHGRNRKEAIQRMIRSLDEFVIEGIITTIPLHKKLLNNKKFINSDFNVSWLDNEKII